MIAIDPTGSKNSASQLSSQDGVDATQIGQWERRGCLPKAVATKVAEKAIVREDIERAPWLCLPTLHRAEVELSRSVHRLIHHPMPPIEVEKAIAWVEGKLGIQLAAGSAGRRR